MNMNKFLERYSLDNTFHRLLADSNALLSGSAALALYLDQEGVVAGYEPNDLDIWISTRVWLGDESCMNHKRWLDPWIDFITHSGYHIHVEEGEEGEEKQDHYMEQLNRIRQVITFKRDDKKIQFIIVNVEDLKEYVANYFDFSACMTWWSIESERFQTVYPSLTRQKKMFIRKTSISQGNAARAEQRLQKYKERGFEVVDMPPPYWMTPDLRTEEDVAIWEGVQAFDVWEYDEVPVVEHLRRSEWNIVIGCGTSWYAFDRRPLIRYMEEHRVFDAVAGALYDTPYRQSVIHEAWDSFAYSDYSVYRLVDDRQRIVRGVPKTVYAVETYSTEGWHLGVVADYFGHVTELVQFHMDDVDAIALDVAPVDAVPVDAIALDAVPVVPVDAIALDAFEDDLLFLLADELGVDLLAPPVPVPVYVMSDSEAELYQEMREWMEQ